MQVTAGCCKKNMQADAFSHEEAFSSTLGDVLLVGSSHQTTAKVSTATPLSATQLTSELTEWSLAFALTAHTNSSMPQAQIHLGRQSLKPA